MVVNPFVLEALRAHQLRALYLSSLIQPDLAGNTTYLNPELYTMRLLPPVLPEPLFPNGLPLVAQSPELLGLQGNPAMYVGGGINPVLPLNNIGVEQMMAQGYYPAPGRMLPPQGLYDKRSALTKEDILPYLIPAAGATGFGAVRFAALPKGSPMRLGKAALAAGIGGLAGHGLYSLIKPNAPLAPDPIRIRNAQLGIDSALTGAGIGGLLGAGLGYAAGGSQSVLPFALTGAGLGGIGGYKYAQHRASVPENIPAKDVPSDIQNAVTKQSAYRRPYIPYAAQPDKVASLFSIARTAVKGVGRLWKPAEQLVSKSKYLGTLERMGTKAPTTILGKAKNFLFGRGIDRFERQAITDTLKNSSKGLSKTQVRGFWEATGKGKGLDTGTVEGMLNRFKGGNSKINKAFKGELETWRNSRIAPVSEAGQVAANSTAAAETVANTGTALTNGANKITKIPGYTGPYSFKKPQMGGYSFAEPSKGSRMFFKGTQTAPVSGGQGTMDTFMDQARKGAGHWFTHPIENIKDIGRMWQNVGNVPHGYAKAIGHTVGAAAVPYATYASVSKFMEPNHRDNGGYQINHF